MLDEEFTLQGKLNKVVVTKQNVEYTPSVNALGDYQPYNTTKNIVKEKPWSAHLRQRHSGELFCTLSAHKDLPFPATTPLTK